MLLPPLRGKGGMGGRLRGFSVPPPVSSPARGEEHDEETSALVFSAGFWYEYSPPCRIAAHPRGMSRCSASWHSRSSSNSDGPPPSSLNPFSRRSKSVRPRRPPAFAAT